MRTFKQFKPIPECAIRVNRLSCLPLLLLGKGNDPQRNLESHHWNRHAPFSPECSTVGAIVASEFSGLPPFWALLTERRMLCYGTPWAQTALQMPPMDHASGLVSSTEPI